MLATYDPVKTNNLDLLRLCLASTVVLGHSRLLIGHVHLSWPFNGAAMAVDAFFVISGFLIASSYDRDSALMPYLIRRGFRIYPLYAVVVIMQLLGMMAVVPGHIPFGEVLRYLFFNLIFANFMAHDVGGLLAHNSDIGINPSLWTLKVEVGFYLVFPLLWWSIRRYGGIALPAIFLLSTSYALYFGHAGESVLAKQLPGALRFFVIGMAMYRYREWIRPPNRLGWLALLPVYVLALSPLRTEADLVYPFIVGALVWIVGFALPSIALPRDFSYGIYLVHSPLIQLGIVAGLYLGDLPTSLALYAAVIAVAVVAEIFIEVPAINMGRTLSHRFHPKHQAAAAARVP